MRKFLGIVNCGRATAHSRVRFRFVTHLKREMTQTNGIHIGVYSSSQDACAAPRFQQRLCRLREDFAAANRPAHSRPKTLNRPLSSVQRRSARHPLLWARARKPGTSYFLELSVWMVSPAVKLNCRAEKWAACAIKLIR